MVSEGLYEEETLISARYKNCLTILTLMLNNVAVLHDPNGAYLLRPIFEYFCHNLPFLPLCPLCSSILLPAIC